MMQRFALLCLSIMCLSLPLAAMAAQLSFGGDVEINTDYRETVREKQRNGSDFDKTELAMGGRIEIITDARQDIVHADWPALFILARVKLDAMVRGDVNIEEAYGQIGYQKADIRFGRFEAEELFSVGEDIFIETAPDLGESGQNPNPGRYELDQVRGPFRIYLTDTEQHENVGQFALTLRPIDWYRLEITSLYGNIKDRDDTYDTQDMNIVGIRPVSVIYIQNFTFKFGLEYSRETAQSDWGLDKRETFGGGVNLTAGFESGFVAASYAQNSRWGSGGIDFSPDIDTWSAGLTGGAYLKNHFLGFGLFYTDYENTTTAYEKIHQQGYLTYGYQLFNKMWIFLATSLAKCDYGLVDHPKISTHSQGIRMRIQYTF